VGVYFNVDLTALKELGYFAEVLIHSGETRENDLQQGVVVW
jgi:hypothetical protein